MPKPPPPVSKFHFDVSTPCPDTPLKSSFHTTAACAAPRADKAIKPVANIDATSAAEPNDLSLRTGVPPIWDL
ncbi:hypothetical protein [Phytohabitans rumicis]|uniref:Uncharacterized protein n=1 Tax=Phytohabitans rumicis TaxID=1076125 RepID=A0A6V8KZ60_9ACTN|nr:hypothetical protein [Phytohabitans rumicis]GFJ87106.1 hypothetical protein Prum_007480 [Phytohabitans rumicis]